MRHLGVKRIDSCWRAEPTLSSDLLRNNKNHSSTFSNCFILIMRCGCYRNKRALGRYIPRMRYQSIAGQNSHTHIDIHTFTPWGNFSYSVHLFRYFLKVTHVGTGRTCTEMPHRESQAWARDPGALRWQDYTLIYIILFQSKPPKATMQLHQEHKTMLTPSIY